MVTNDDARRLVSSDFSAFGHFAVIPAKAGTHVGEKVPAFAGMTKVYQYPDSFLTAAEKTLRSLALPHGLHEMQTRTNRFNNLAVLAVFSLVIVAATASAQARGGGAPLTPPVSAMETMGKLGPIVKDGMLQPVAEFADPAQIIRQRVWVETDFDSDHDGKLDRIHADIVRPGAAEKAGLKVPIIMKGSPYIGPTNGSSNWNVEHEIGASPPARTPVTPRPFQENPPVNADYANTWVPRGLAAVNASNAGTGLSTGCPTSGDSTERNSPKFVIDWLNGRAKGFTTVDGNEEVSATSWSNGKVGMYGGSYEGAMPMAAAVTGVKGLEAIIPISPNTSDYRYYRSYKKYYGSQA